MLENESFTTTANETQQALLGHWGWRTRSELWNYFSVRQKACSNFFYKKVKCCGGKCNLNQNWRKRAMLKAMALSAEGAVAYGLVIHLIFRDPREPGDVVRPRFRLCVLFPGFTFWSLMTRKRWARKVMAPMEAINSYPWFSVSKFIILGETSLSEQLRRTFM